MANPLSIWIVAAEVPALRGGAPIRNYNIVRELAALGNQVTVFCIAEADSQADLAALRQLPGVTVRSVDLPRLGVIGLVAALRKRVIPFMHQFRRSGLANLLIAELANHRPDVVQFEQVNGYYAALPAILRLQQQGSTLVLDAHNVEQTLLAESLQVFSAPKRWLGRYILPHYRAIENQAARRVDLVLACSAADKLFFERLGARRTLLAPNGVDLGHFAPLGPTTERSVLFMGGATYPPNEDALRWYVHEVHPLIRRQVPDARFYVLGSHPPAWLVEAAAGDDSIITPGFVPDERDFLAKAAVCISPMRLGSGTGIKVLTYMATARAIVSTAVGARGILCQDGEQLLLRETPQTFADGVAQLLTSPAKRQALGRQARKTIETYYDWHSIAATIQTHYKEVCHVSS